MRHRILAVAIALCVSTTVHAQNQRVVVPAGFWVTGDNSWSRIQAAGPMVQIVSPQFDTFNVGVTDFNAARSQFDANRSVGQLVLGYVDTSNGNRNPGDVDNDIALWYANYSTNYSTHIDGIFFDQGPDMTVNAGNQTYYANLNSRLKLAHPSAKEMLNAAGFGSTDPWVMSVTDYVTLWEAPYVDPTNSGKASYRDRYVATSPDLLSAPPPAWWDSYGSRVTHIVFNAQSRTISPSGEAFGNEPNASGEL